MGTPKNNQQPASHTAETTAAEVREHHNPSVSTRFIAAFAAAGLLLAGLVTVHALRGAQGPAQQAHTAQQVHATTNATAPQPTGASSSVAQSGDTAASSSRRNHTRRGAVGAAETTYAGPQALSTATLDGDPLLPPHAWLASRSDTTTPSDRDGAIQPRPDTEGTVLGKPTPSATIIALPPETPRSPIGEDAPNVPSLNPGDEPPAFTLPSLPTFPGTSDPIAPPSTPAPVEPPQPTSPADPTGPTDPAVPVEPVEPTEPVAPTDPTDPTGPSEPLEPPTTTEPTDPPNANEPQVPSAPTTGTNTGNASTPLEPTPLAGTQTTPMTGETTTQPSR